MKEESHVDTASKLFDDITNMSQEFKLPFVRTSMPSFTSVGRM
jgi:hypothetical protein